MQNQPSRHFSKDLNTLKRMFTGTEDIISVIEEDHKPLKELIKIMKDSEKSLTERRQAFMEFAPLLMTHAKSEEKALYEHMKTVAGLKEHAFEGDTEHMVADQLCEEIKRTTNEDAMGAKIKVLVEMVEHHIKEEEKDILPDVKKKVGKDKLVFLTKVYVDVQADIIADGQDDAPREADLQKGKLHS
ncbi:MAG TPA: hemerythrin domain-containing protein [Bdellovibrionales bacterium]|nr:hemerythrin domain-containing protein [Bdellovibrionales bacterium]